MNEDPVPAGTLYREAKAVSDARRILRRGTSDLHDQAEAVLGDGPMRDLRSYVGMLGATLEMTDAVLSAVDSHLPKRLTSGLEHDRARLRADMADLGTPIVAGTSHVMIGTRAGALGALYVCEGSKLGARVLAPQVEAGLGLTARRGAAYLNGEGTAPGARWRAFVETLNSDVTGKADLKNALLAARRVFHLLIDSYEAARWPAICETRGSDR